VAVRTDRATAGNRVERFGHRAQAVEADRGIAGPTIRGVVLQPSTQEVAQVAEAVTQVGGHRLRCALGKKGPGPDPPELPENRLQIALTHVTNIRNLAAGARCQQSYVRHQPH
jgi:hypothetical protein